MDETIPVWVVIDMDTSDGQIFSVSTFVLEKDALAHKEHLDKENTQDDDYEAKIIPSTVR